MTELFPFYQNVYEKTFLIVGGGKVAREKAESLNRFHINVELVSHDFNESDLDGADFVIGATNDKALNKRIAELCQSRNIPVNIVDDPFLCTFIMPAMVKRGDLCVAVSTNGKSPAYASRLRKEIEALLPEDIEEILIYMGSLRETAASLYPTQEERKAYYLRELSKFFP